jgi:hypothetical protein
LLVVVPIIVKSGNLVNSGLDVSRVRKLEWCCGSGFTCFWASRIRIL